MQPAYFVAFSGHRPSNQSGRTESDLNACIPAIKGILTGLQKKAGNVGGQIHFVSGLAAGSDIIACETAIGLGIPVHFVLAKPEKEFLETYHHSDPEKDFSDWLTRAHALLATVRPDPERTDIPINPHHTIRVGADSRHSPDCYAEVNTKLLEIADVLLTLSNGRDSESIAGTTHLTEQAEAIGIPSINLNPEKPVEAVQIPETFADSSCHSLAPFTRNSPHISCDITTEASPFRALADCLSSAAARSAQWFRQASAFAIACHAIATALAAFVAAYYYFFKKFDGSYTFFALFAVIELILVFLGWWLERRVHGDNAQKTWLHCRFARELMRSVEHANAFLDPLFPEIARHQTEWRRFAVTVGLQLRAEKTPPLDCPADKLKDLRDAYIKNRVQDQETFFQKSAEKSRPPAEHFRKVTHWAGFLALIFVLFAAGIKVYDAALHKSTKLLGSEFFTYTLLLLLPIWLPLIASLGASFGAVFDYERRATRYHEISDNLNRTAIWLPQLSTRHDIANEVRHTEEILLDELIEWYSAQKKGMGH